MLITREEGQKLILETSDGTIEITILDTKWGKVKLEMNAPPGVGIVRKELRRRCAHVIHSQAG